MDTTLNSEQLIQVKCFYLIGKYKKKIKKLKTYKLELKNLFEKKNKEYYINRYLLNKEKEELQKEYQKKKAQLELDAETLERKKRIYSEFFVDIFLYQQEHYQCIYKVFKNLLIKKERLDDKELQLNKLREQLHMCICDKNINETYEVYEEKEVKKTEERNTNIEQLYNLDIDQIYEHIIQETIEEGEKKIDPNEKLTKEEPTEIQPIQQFQESEEHKWNYKQEEREYKIGAELLNESIKSSKLSKSSKENDDKLVNYNIETLEYNSVRTEREMDSIDNEEKQLQKTEYEKENAGIKMNQNAIVEQNTEKTQNNINYVNVKYTNQEQTQFKDDTVTGTQINKEEDNYYENQEKKTGMKENHSETENWVQKNEIDISNELIKNEEDRIMLDKITEPYINEREIKNSFPNKIQNNVQTTNEEKPIYFDYNDDFENIYRKYVSNSEFAEEKRKIDPIKANKKYSIEKRNEFQQNQNENKGKDESWNNEEMNNIKDEEQNEQSNSPKERKEKSEKELEEVIEKNIVANLCTYFSGNYEDTDDNLDGDMNEKKTKEVPNESELHLLSNNEKVELNNTETEQHINNGKQEMKKHTNLMSNSICINKFSNNNVFKNRYEQIYNVNEYKEHKQINIDHATNEIIQNQSVKRSHSVLSKIIKENETQSHTFKNKKEYSPVEISYLDLDSEIDYTKMNYNEYETMVSLQRKNTLNKLNSMHKLNSFINPSKSNGTLINEDNSNEQYAKENSQEKGIMNPLEEITKQSKNVIEREEDDEQTQWNSNEVDLNSSNDKLNRSFKSKTRKRSGLRNIQELMNSMSYRKAL